MKVNLYILALLAGMGCAQQLNADTYLSEGVDKAHLAESERFFDCGKGYYWPALYQKSFQQYQSAHNSFSFLGELQDRVTIDKTTVYTTAYNWYYSGWESHLRSDANTCWYQTSANVIQYWQTYYGVFAQNHEQLPYGLTYDRSALNDLGGTQSLEVGMVFYDNIDNRGGFLRAATDYYFSGGDLSSIAISYSYRGNTIINITSVSNYKRSTIPTGGSSSAGGYFADYFPEALQAGSQLDNLTSLSIDIDQNTSEAGEALLIAMGCTLQPDGTIEREAAGQIAYVSMRSASNEGHAITCYGFELSEDQSIKKISVTNSDDQKYELFDLYVGQDMKLYTDKSCTTEWEYAELTWTIESFDFINTPDELIQMYEDYTASENTLKWNGHATTWSEQYSNTADELPTASTGWEVYVDSETNDNHDGYYNTYYDEQRTVEFGNYGKEQSHVTVTGTVRAGGMRLTASGSDGYNFTGTSADTDVIHLTTPDKNGTLEKSGNSTDVLQNLSLLADAVSLKAGELTVGEGAMFQATAGTVFSGAAFSISGGFARLDSLEVQDNGIFKTGVGASFSGQLTLQQGASMQFDLTGLHDYVLDFDGQLTLLGEVELTWIGGESLVGLSAAAHSGDIKLIQFDSTQTHLDVSLFIVTGAVVTYNETDHAMYMRLVVPEPTTATLSIAALGLLCLRRRRR